MEVETRSDQAVLTITLNRPDVLNSLNNALRQQFATALRDAEEPAVRAVVITGAGRAFCVGQDLAELHERDDGIGALLREEYHGLVVAIRALEKPVIAAVNGPAAGAGLSLACACDIRIAAEGAKFVPAFVNAGPRLGRLAVHPCAPWLRPRVRVDEHRARALGERSSRLGAGLGGSRR